MSEIVRWNLCILSSRTALINQLLPNDSRVLCLLDPYYSWLSLYSWINKQGQYTELIKIFCEIPWDVGDVFDMFHCLNISRSIFLILDIKKLMTDF